MTTNKLPTRRILLCDDELHILRAAEFKFKRAGYDVVCANDGQEGWERIEERRPDIVVTDCQMPRLSGLGLAEHLGLRLANHSGVFLVSGRFACGRSLFGGAGLGGSRRQRGWVICRLSGDLGESGRGEVPGDGLERDA